MTVQHVAGALAPPAGKYDADIIILSLDRPDETADAVRSALAQRGVTRHVVVVDQGSRPENLGRLAALLRDRQDATLVRLPENLGVAGGRNRASAIGHGRVIVALDNDAEFATADTVAEAVATLDDDLGLGALGFRILAHANGEDDQSSWGYPPRLKPLAAGSFDVATFVGAGHAIRRTAWEQAGGYDEALFFCWEEFDFCLRAVALGWTIRYRGDIAVLHKVSPQQRVAWTARRWFFFVRNRIYIERKYGSGWVALVPRIAGYWVRGLLNGVGGQTLPGLAEAVRMSRATRTRPLPPHARAYLARTDRAHRGSPLGRLRDEVMATLPAPSGVNDPVRLPH